jgi:hypothetical protein
MTTVLALAIQAPMAAAAPAPVVFFDIAAPTLPSQAAFYHDIFDWQIKPDGTFSVPVASPLPGNLRVESPVAGPVAERVVYIGVANINATLAKIVDHGGSIVFPRQVYPGIVILALFKDPAGNRVGLVEMKGDRPVVPPAH